MRSFSKKSEKLAQDGSNLAGVIAALPAPQKENVEQSIRSYLKDLPEKDTLSLKAELYGPFNSDAMLSCEEGWRSGGNPLKVDSRAMSDGTLRFIAILTALLTLPERTQLIVEEVDNGLRERGDEADAGPGDDRESEGAESRRGGQRRRADHDDDPAADEDRGPPVV